MASPALKNEPKTKNKSLASEPEVQPVAKRLDETQIATRAYELWQERGCPIGSQEEDWFQAEQELRN